MEWKEAKSAVSITYQRMNNAQILAEDSIQ